ncbi:MAG: hypothetical protein ACYCWC_00150 [Rhodocyclaceae bacterium]
MPFIRLDNGCLPYCHVPLLDAAQFHFATLATLATLGRARRLDDSRWMR